MQEFYNYDYYDSDHSEIDTPLFIYKTEFSVSCL